MKYLKKINVLWLLFSFFTFIVLGLSFGINTDILILASLSLFSSYAMSINKVWFLDIKIAMLVLLCFLFFKDGYVAISLLIVLYAIPLLVSTRNTWEEYENNDLDVTGFRFFWLTYFTMVALLMCIGILKLLDVNQPYLMSTLIIINMLNVALLYMKCNQYWYVVILTNFIYLFMYINNPYYVLIVTFLIISKMLGLIVWRSNVD